MVKNISNIEMSNVEHSAAKQEIGQAPTNTGVSIQPRKIPFAQAKESAIAARDAHANKSSGVSTAETYRIATDCAGAGISEEDLCALLGIPGAAVE